MLICRLRPNRGLILQDFNCLPVESFVGEIFIIPLFMWLFNVLEGNQRILLFHLLYQSSEEKSKLLNKDLPNQILERFPLPETTFQQSPNPI